MFLLNASISIQIKATHYFQKKYSQGRKVLWNTLFWPVFPCSLSVQHWYSGISWVGPNVCSLSLFLPYSSTKTVCRIQQKSWEIYRNLGLLLTVLWDAREELAIAENWIPQKSITEVFLTDNISNGYQNQVMKVKSNWIAQPSSEEFQTQAMICLTR